MLFETAKDRGIIRIARTGTCIDDDVDGGQLMLMQAERLSDQALDAIAVYGSANDAGSHGKSKAGLRSRVGTNKDGEEGIGKPARIFVDAIEVRFVVETLRRSERPGRCLQSLGSNDDAVRQTVRRLRPFARRRDRTRRPARVAMRARKP